MVEILTEKNVEPIKMLLVTMKFQPPINKITVIALIKIIALYSAKKNNAKPMLEYSTLKPLTSSLSASGRSNGARFVSAKTLIINMKKIGKKGTKKKIKY